MRKQVILGAFAAWMTLLGLGLAWSTNPVAKPPSNNIAAISREDVIGGFKIRLAGVPDSSASRIFDYEEWAYREMRARQRVFWGVWIACGAVLIWGARKELSAPKSSNSTKLPA